MGLEKEKIDVEKFIRDTRISEVDLDKAFFEQASLRAYYGALAAERESFANRLETAFESQEALLSRNIRQSLIEQKIKPTEKMIEEIMRSDSKWVKMKNAVYEAQAQATIAKALVQSLVDRRDMLIQLGADRRDESKGQLRMLEIQKDNAALASVRYKAAQALKNSS